MLNALQNIFIIVLRPISRASCKLNDRVRDICIQLTCMLFPLYFIWYYTGLKHRVLIPDFLGNHTAKQLMGCIFLLILIIFSLDRVPQKVRWNKWIMYPMIICGIWMVVISFIHPVGSGYRAFAVMLIIVYPCLFFVWNNRGDYEKLFDPLARAVCLTGVLFFLSSFFIAAKGMLVIDYYNRCSGLFENANMFSMVGMVSTCGALYLIVKNRGLNYHFFFYCIALGSGIAIVLMGQSRISIIVCIMNILVTLFFHYRYSEKSELSVIVLKLFCVVGFIVTMVLLSQLCFLIEQSAKEKAIEAASENAVEVVDPNALPPDVVIEQQSALDRFDFSGNTTLDTFTAGRYRIWQGYFQFLNLTGNDFSKADWEVLTQKTVVHAHNNFIEMAYRFGVPLGILFIFIEVVACIKALQYLFINRQKRIVLLLPLLFIVVFLFESMFDIATLPFERDAPFYFYMALIPMADMNFRFKDKTQLNCKA